MASTTSAPTVKDSTFRSYSAEQAKIYATTRLSYAAALYDTVLQHHSETGGQFELLLDVGCGPGNATRDVALSFNEAIGIDPGASMIDAARGLGGKTKSGKDIRYELSSAEEISNVQGLEPNSVDLLTAANAAHWFDEMDKFWVEAAKLVKPGGTVALWTHSPSYCHPNTPNAAKIREVQLRLERGTLAQYSTPGNLLAKNLYDDLPLPWDIPTPVTAFPKSAFVKYEYDRDGVPSNGVSFFGGGFEATLDQMEKGLGTVSAVTRWRDAHPDLVGTDKDIAKVYVNELREALPEDQREQKILYGCGTAILLFKKV